jgi:hypothetical protein
MGERVAHVIPGAVGLDERLLHYLLGQRRLARDEVGQANQYVVVALVQSDQLVVPAHRRRW